MAPRAITSRTFLKTMLRRFPRFKAKRSMAKNKQTPLLRMEASTQARCFTRNTTAPKWGGFSFPFRFLRSTCELFSNKQRQQNRPLTSISSCNPIAAFSLESQPVNQCRHHASSSEYSLFRKCQVGHQASQSRYQARCGRRLP